ncbi:hypothetical protein [Streptobacillus felis]|uniref:hypothetical protein n=1 Tax=Streptobacillus felis TaxID=1384509 RepID=UPI0015D26EC7|nr:hypothetical protein [Streptobacillus felis]
MGWINLSSILNENICVKIMEKYDIIEHAIEDFKKYNLDEKILDKLITASKVDDKIFINRCMDENIKILCFKDSNYPKKLKESGFIFPYIYLKSNKDINELNSILSISSNYDLIDNTKNIIEEVLDIDKEISISLVSETEADRYIQKLFKNKENTMVLISSRDFKYIPKYYNIEKDLLITLSPFEDIRSKKNILRSSSLLAGISDFLYIPESSKISRAMIMSKIMNDLGKEIFASTSYGKRYLGCNYILKNNIAKLVMNKEDINEEVKNG